jgi:hypothetical protein
MTQYVELGTGAYRYWSRWDLLAQPYTSGRTSENHLKTNLWEFR